MTFQRNTYAVFHAENAVVVRTLLQVILLKMILRDVHFTDHELQKQESGETKSLRVVFTSFNGCERPTRMLNEDESKIDSIRTQQKFCFFRNKNKQTKL